MNTRTLLIAALALAAAVAAGYGLGRLNAGAEHAAVAVSAPVEAERKALYWYDPMKPEARFDKPGRSPFMDMDLVPKYADQMSSGGVAVDPRVAQSLGLRLAVVTRERVASSFEAVGTIGFNERDVVVVQTRTAGFVERVMPHAVGDVVGAGALLAELRVPEWAGAQMEYLALRSSEAGLAAAARQRLVLLGMPEALIADVERQGRAQPLLAITSPVGGVIMELGVRAGMSLPMGATLARINGLATMWLEVAVPEAQAGQLAVGRTVAVTLTAYPGTPLQGRIAAVLPDISRETRTLRARIELPNPGARLKAGMAGVASLGAPAEEALLVPSEAVIRTGQRALVFVVDEGGRYRPVNVQLGREAGGRMVITQGLQEGQQVVASGQFLIDSEASLGGVVGRTSSPAASAPAMEMGK